jgi:nicotinamide-nucleotide amidase
MVPKGATILENRHGSAAGIWLEDARGRWVAMLPGVPREFKGMTADVLLPRIAARLAASGEAPSVVQSRTLRTTGIAESALADALGALAKDPHGVRLAYLPGWEGVDLRLMVSGLPAAEASARLSRAEAALRDVAGKWIYGTDDAELSELILTELRARGMRIAVAESCTGGMLGMRLTAISGSSDVVQGGTIAYDNAVKVRELGVREETLKAHGAVSEETAREMATGVRSRFGVDVGVSITGVAGPGGGTPEKPVGTFCVAVDLRGAVHSLRTAGVGDRHEIRQRATQAALNLVRRSLVG